MNKKQEPMREPIPTDLIAYCEFLGHKSDREIEAVRSLYKTTLSLIIVFLGIVSAALIWFGYSSIPQIIEDQVEKEFRDRNIHELLDEKVEEAIDRFPLTRFGNLSSLGQSLALDAWYDKKFTLTSFKNKSEENKLIPDSEIREQLHKLSTVYGWVTVSDGEVEITDLGEKEMNLVQLYFIARWGR